MVSPRPRHDARPNSSLQSKNSVAEFLMRHGASMDMANGNGHFESGCSGWSETYAADGYVLRVEWSRFELRGTTRSFELPPTKAYDIRGNW
jgi:hypothetical protein